MFDAVKETDNLVAWVRDWFENNGKTADAVIGISGGKDSTVAAYVLKKAIGEDRIVGVMMPNGSQPDIADSKRVIDLLGIRSYEINIKPAVDAVTASLPIPVSSDTKINIPPRIRMTTLYAIAQSLPNGGRVVNTCNRSEDYVGYSTKFGDSAGDVGILSGFLVSEILAIGKLLGVPEDLLYKIPADGLCGKTDEDNLGFKYSQLDHYILTHECDDIAVKENISRRHILNLHKLNPLPYYRP